MIACDTARTKSLKIFKKKIFKTFKTHEICKVNTKSFYSLFLKIFLITKLNKKNEIYTAHKKVSLRMFVSALDQQETLLV